MRAASRLAMVVAAAALAAACSAGPQTALAPGGGAVATTASPGPSPTAGPGPGPGATAGTGAGGRTPGTVGPSGTRPGGAGRVGRTATSNAGSAPGPQPPVDGPRPEPPGTSITGVVDLNPSSAPPVGGKDSVQISTSFKTSPGGATMEMTYGGKADLSILKIVMSGSSVEELTSKDSACTPRKGGGVTCTFGDLAPGEVFILELTEVPKDVTFLFEATEADGDKLIGELESPMKG